MAAMVIFGSEVLEPLCGSKFDFLSVTFISHNLEDLYASELANTSQELTFICYQAST